MVNKVYVVNQCPSVIDEDEKHLGSATTIQNQKNSSDDHRQMKRIDRYILHISNEMVKMKPSNIFQDDNSSAPKYWNSNSIIKWNKECMSGGDNHTTLRLLVKLVVLSFLFVGLGFLIISWIYPYSSPTTRPSIDQDMIVNVNKSLSVTVNSSSMTEESTKINNLLKTSTLPSTNVISHGVDDVHASEKSKSRDDVLLTKKYVERVNFYTTTNSNLFSVKVSPTLPTFTSKHQQDDRTSELPTENYANDNSCQSTSLPLCQGVLSYDLTDPSRTWNLTNVDYQHFQHLLSSQCSKRAAEFVCHMLEPECRPSRMKNLKPCRRICKGIFESCSHIIASSEVLTEFFDCNTYIDSNDHSMCEDITRISKQCFDDEFKCSDSSCIKSKWRCDNIRDCPSGDDEDDCTFCNYDEFKCVSDQKCISDKWFCDGFDDCVDGSDETSCDIENDGDEEDERSALYYDDKDYDQDDSFDQDDHNDSDGDRIVSTGDDVVPIFVNPNATSSDSVSSTTTKIPKRFRSTMRKQPPTTEKPPEETTTMKQKSEIVKASTHSSHSSPCPEFELRCVDGLCITLDQICDKIQDCSDNSDELHCEYDN